MKSILLFALLSAAPAAAAPAAAPAKAAPAKLAPLKGEIAFTKRDGDVSNVYKISIPGGKPVKLFANKDSVNSNSLFPRWTADGSELHFVAMKDGKWANWTVQPDGTNARVIPGDADLVSQRSRSPDLDVDEGKFFRKDEKGAEVVLYKYMQVGEGGGVNEAVWTPDHQHILFQYNGLGSPSVYVIDPDGKHMTKLTQGSEPDMRPTP
jgi:Tol biopolymer transport system component